MNKNFNWKVGVLSFIALILISSYIIPSITSLSQNYDSQSIAQVGSKKLTSRDLEIKNLFFKNPKYSENDLDDLIIKELLLQDSKEHNIIISEEDLRQYIKQLPLFQSRGFFDSEKFAYFVQLFTVKDELVKILSDQASSQLLLTYLEDSEYLYPQEIQDSGFFWQKREFYSKNFFVKDYYSQVTCSEEELQDFYIQNKAQYIGPDYSKFVCIELDLKDCITPIKNSEIRRFYDSNKVFFQRKERRSGLVLNIPQHLVPEIEEDIKLNGQLSEKYASWIVQKFNNVELNNSYGASRKLFELDLYTITKYRDYFLVLTAIEKERPQSLEEASPDIKTYLEQQRESAFYNKQTRELSSSEKTKAFLNKYLSLQKTFKISQNTSFEFEEIKNAIFKESKLYGVLLKKKKILVFYVEEFLKGQTLSFLDALPKMQNDLKTIKAQKLAQEQALTFLQNPDIKLCLQDTIDRFNKKLPSIFVKSLFKNKGNWEILSLEDNFVVYYAKSSVDIPNTLAFANLNRHIEFLNYIYLLQKKTASRK